MSDAFVILRIYSLTDLITLKIVFVGPESREDKGFLHSYDVLVDSYQSYEDLSDPEYYKMAGRVCTNINFPLHCPLILLVLVGFLLDGASYAIHGHVRTSLL